MDVVWFLEMSDMREVVIIMLGVAFGIPLGSALNNLVRVITQAIARLF